MLSPRKFKYRIVIFKPTILLSNMKSKPKIVIIYYHGNFSMQFNTKFEELMINKEILYLMGKNKL